MSNDPIGNDVRRTRRARRLGESPRCVLCGYQDPDALMVVERSTLETHHVLGRANHPDLTVLLCRNCHALEGERMRDADVPLAHDRRGTVLDTVEAGLRALALFLRSLAAAIEGWATALAALAAALDRELPTWRELGQARG
jgi:hypothetical protein